MNFCDFTHTLVKQFRWTQSFRTIRHTEIMATMKLITALVNVTLYVSVNFDQAVRLYDGQRLKRRRLSTVVSTHTTTTSVPVTHRWLTPAGPHGIPLLHQDLRSNLIATLDKLAGFRGNRASAVNPGSSHNSFQGDVEQQSGSPSPCRSPRLTSFSPNTYTFTKGLAEQICYDYRQELPLVIFRPSIVTNAEKEPLPGWIDNFNGPIGLLVGMGTGVMRSGCIKLDNHINCIPVDVSIKAIIIAAWKRANSSSAQPILPIYNSAADVCKTATYNFLVTDGEELYYKTPTSQVLWAPGGVNAICLEVYYVAFFFLQFLPSLVLDALIKLSGHKPMLLRLQRRIFDATISLKYFTDNEWVFKTANFRGLQLALLDQDRETFDINYITKGLVSYYADSIMGARRYLFKETDDTIPAARKKIMRFKWINRVIKYALFFFLGYLLFCKISVALS
ncbi:fatty acyl-CoA reductase wat-like [Aedes albopictus]|uniref:Fatty acyl-CoA reductase n=1 Tax=Aedes albopictus TaxID=7160 RepID=A0ABM1Y1I8_AEDAL